MESAADEVDATGGPRASAHKLKPGFRFLHEPSVRANAVHHLHGNDDVIQSLVDRLRHSSGGAFLLTGFRGVGKTSVVNQTLADLATEDGDGQVAYVVRLNVARPLAPSDVLVAAIRRLFEVINEAGDLLKLEERVRTTLVLAYLRTALHISNSDSREVERGLSASLNFAGLPGGGVLPKVDLSAKGVHTTATQASFLAYSDYDLEHDFLRILELLASSTVATSTSARRKKRRKPFRTVRVMVVLDELDKLTATKEGYEALEAILGGLKNVLGSGHAHFVFVAGPDVYDRARADADRGTGLYESVFSWTGYVGCQWDATRSLLDALLVESSRLESRDRALIQHASRGIPRRLVQEVGNRVTWSNLTPLMVIPDGMSALGAVVESFVTVVEEQRRAVLSMVSDRLESDRRSLGAYIASDWILRSGGRVFGVADIVDEERSLFAIDPALRLRAVDIAALIEALAHAGLLESSDDEGAYATRVGGSAKPTTYHLTDTIAAQLKGYGGGVARQPIAAASSRPPGYVPPLVAPAPPPYDPALLTDAFADATNQSAARPSAAPTASMRDPSAGASHSLDLGRLPWMGPEVDSSVKGGRYRFTDRIGSGSAGTVYRAEDNMTGDVVAVKVLEALSLRSDPEVRARFEREAELAQKLQHPRIVRTVGVLNEPDGRVGLVMSLIDGESLAEVHKPVTPMTAASWGMELLDALAYLFDRDIARIDLKPGNIIITRTGPVIIDLGTAKGMSASRPAYATVPGMLIGTPAYLAPEQIDGDRVDIRSDLYSLGLILVELIDGKLPYDTSSAMAAMAAISAGYPDPPLAAASKGLREVILRAIRRDPAERFHDPAEMTRALEKTLEVRTGGVDGHSTVQPSARRTDPGDR